MSMRPTIRREDPLLRSRQLTALLDATQAVLQRSPVVSVVLLLEDLREELDRHFEAEERGGYLAEARAAAPWLDARIAKLLEQHGDFRQWVDELLDLACRSRTEPGARETVAVAFGELRHALQRHERDEDQLVRDAFQLDLGGN